MGVITIICGLLISSAVITMATPYGRIVPVEDPCNEEPTNDCEFGIYKNSCERLRCRLGPNEICQTGYSKRECGEGMTCIGGVCIACYGKKCYYPPSGVPILTKALTMALTPELYPMGNRRY